jgi:hypothetical protein
MNFYFEERPSSPPIEEQFYFGVVDKIVASKDKEISDLKELLNEFTERSDKAEQVALKQQQSMAELQTIVDSLQTEFDELLMESREQRMRKVARKKCYDELMTSVIEDIIINSSYPHPLNELQMKQRNDYDANSFMAGNVHVNRILGEIDSCCEFASNRSVKFLKSLSNDIMGLKYVENERRVMTEPYLNGFLIATLISNIVNSSSDLYSGPKEYKGYAAIFDVQIGVGERPHAKRRHYLKIILDALKIYIDNLVQIIQQHMKPSCFNCEGEHNTFSCEQECLSCPRKFKYHLPKDCPENK